MCSLTMVTMMMVTIMTKRVFSMIMVTMMTIHVCSLMMVTTHSASWSGDHDDGDHTAGDHDDGDHDDHTCVLLDDGDHPLGQSVRSRRILTKLGER